MSVYDRHYHSVIQTLKRATLITRTTPGELLFLVSLLANFVLGKLVHVCSPEYEVYNYFNDKRNIINQFFVKRGWGWTTIYIVSFYALLHASKRVTQTQLVRAGIRWAVLTAWWILFTQWCFGVPIMDRVFILTGGKCYIEDQVNVSNANPAISMFVADKGRLSSSGVSSYECRKIKGSWEGGHDPSGHVFLLVQASCYMFLEGAAFWGGWTRLMKSTKERFSAKITVESIAEYVKEHPHVLLIQLIGLWWWMLLMTNIYFHSLFEKFVGLLFGLVGIGGIIFMRSTQSYLPRSGK